MQRWAPFWIHATTSSENAPLALALAGSAPIALRGGAPSLPVGITGTERLRGVAWLLRRPKITVNIGRPFYLPPVSSKLTKADLVEVTNLIMGHIAELLPVEYRGNYAEQGKLDGIKG